MNLCWKQQKYQLRVLNLHEMYAKKLQVSVVTVFVCFEHRQRIGEQHT